MPGGVFKPPAGDVQMLVRRMQPGPHLAAEDKCWRLDVDILKNKVGGCASAPNFRCHFGLTQQDVKTETFWMRRCRSRSKDRPGNADGCSLEKICTFLDIFGVLTDYAANALEGEHRLECIPSFRKHRSRHWHSQQQSSHRRAHLHRRGHLEDGTARGRQQAPV